MLWMVITTFGLELRLSASIDGSVINHATMGIY